MIFKELPAKVLSEGVAAQDLQHLSDNTAWLIEQSFRRT
jgi:hypothetical protein